MYQVVSTSSKGRIVKRLLYNETVTEEGIKSLNDTTFYKSNNVFRLEIVVLLTQNALMNT